MRKYLLEIESCAECPNSTINKYKYTSDGSDYLQCLVVREDLGLLRVAMGMRNINPKPYEKKLNQKIYPSFRHPFRWVMVEERFVGLIGGDPKNYTPEKKYKRYKGIPKWCPLKNLGEKR